MNPTLQFNNIMKKLYVMKNDIKLRPDGSKSETTKCIRSSTVFVDEGLSLFLESSSEWNLFAINTDV